MDLTSHNPYQTPAADLGCDINRIEDIRHYKAYVGRNAPYYVSQWLDLRQGRDAKNRLNLGALLFGPFWFLYRKMYLYFVLICLLLIVQAAIEYSIFGVASLDPSRSSAGGLVFGFMLSLVMSWYANRLYFHHVTRKIRACRLRAISERSVSKALKNRGGVDFLIPLSIVVAVALLGYASLTFGLVSVTF